MLKNYKFDAQIIADNIHKVFGRRLETILVFGSAARKAGFDDLDMVVVLDEPASVDMSKLKEAVKECHQVRLPVELQVLYRKLDLPIDPDLFSINTWGAAFIDVLKKAKILYGRNPFEKTNVDPDEKNRQLLKKIQQYLFLLRNLFVNEDSLDNLRNIFAKKTRMAMIDWLVLTDLRSSRGLGDTGMGKKEIHRIVSELGLNSGMARLARILVTDEPFPWVDFQDEQFCFLCLQLLEKAYHHGLRYLRKL